jgi:hypothetical protein
MTTTRGDLLRSIDFESTLAILALIVISITFFIIWEKNKNMKELKDKEKTNIKLGVNISRFELLSHRVNIFAVIFISIVLYLFYK